LAARRGQKTLSEKIGMPRINLNQKAIAKLQAPHPDGRQTIYWCDELKGFGVVCSGTTNQRLFIAQRDVSGRSRRVTLGTVTGLALAEARQRAENVLDDLRRGIDPKKKVKVYTLQSALDEYLGPKGAEHDTLAPASVALYWQIERLLKPWLNRNLAEITVEMVDKKHKELAKQIGTSTANLAMRVLRIMWNYAADRSKLPECPTLCLKKKWYEEKRRTRSVTFEQLPTFYRAVLDVESGVIRDYVMLLLFTGMRRGEAAGLRWTDIDFAKKQINVPAEATKAKRPHELPMSTLVHDLLVKRRTAAGASKFVFPGSGATGCITSATNALKAIADATGILISPHDLRRSFASVAAETPDVSWIALKVMLNHTTKGDVTAGYVQISPERLRVAVQRVADNMASLCGIETVEQRNVVKLR
jgi:integrase